MSDMSGEAARLAEIERRLAALESTLAERLSQTPASSMPDAIEQTEVEPQRCQSLSPRGGVACSLPAGHPAPHQGLPHQIGTWRDPEPQWRRMVDEKQPWASRVASPLAAVMTELADIEYGEANANATRLPFCLARIVAVCEREVGGDWKADPDRCLPREHSTWRALGVLRGYGIYAPSMGDWKNLANYAAHWLRSLCEDGAA